MVKLISQLYMIGLYIKAVEPLSRADEGVVDGGGSGGWARRKPHLIASVLWSNGEVYYERLAD